MKVEVEVEVEIKVKVEEWALELKWECELE